MKTARLAPTKSLLARLLVLAALLAGAPAHAEAPSKNVEKVVIRLDRSVSLDSLGNGTVVQKWTLSPAIYQALVARLSPRTIEEVKDRDGSTRRVPRLLGSPSPASVLAYLGLTSLPVRLDDLRGSLDPKTNTITATYKVPGWAVATGRGKWALPLLDNARWYNPLAYNLPPVSGLVKHSLAGVRGGRASLRFGQTLSLGDKLQLVQLSQVEVHLPRGGRNVKFGKRANGTYALSYEALAPAGGGSKGQEAEFDLLPRKEIVPALHKLYADPTWTSFAVARCSFFNRGAETLQDLRVRCCVSGENTRKGYNEWERIAARVYPGGRVQFALYPLLDAALRNNKSRVTGKVHVEYEYTRPGGRKVRHLADPGRITVLGLNDAVENSLDFSELADPTFYHHNMDAALVMTAFVQPNDPVIKDLKGRLSKALGGLAVNSSDRNSLLFLRTLYDVLRANISYTHPTGGHDQRRRWQHVYHGRDVLRTRAGTCIDLALLYASVAEAVGIDVRLVLVPGHAFPAIRLPQSGQLFFVETTGCGDGTLARSYPFTVAARFARNKYNEWSSLGQCITIDVSEMRKHVSPAELPRLGLANPLDEWKIQMPPVRPEVEVTEVVGTKHDVVVKGRTGVQVHAVVRVKGGRGQELTASLFLLDKQGRFLRATKVAFSEPGEAALTAKSWAASIRLLPPKHDPAVYQLYFFLPYEELPGAAADGVEREYAFEVDVYNPLYKEWVGSKTQKGKLQVKRGNPAVAHGFRVKQESVVRKGKAGIELTIEAQLDGCQERACRLVASLCDRKHLVARTAKGEAVNRVHRLTPTEQKQTLKGVVLFFSYEDIEEALDAGVERFSFAVNVWDENGKKWLAKDSYIIDVTR